MESPTAGLRWADYTAARGRFFDRVNRTGAAARPDRGAQPGPAPPALAVVPALEAAWCSGWAEEVAALFTPDGVRHRMALPEHRVQGRAAITLAVAAVMRAVPDGAVEVTAVARGEDVVTLQWTFTGTQARDLAGLPACGQPIALPGVSVCRMHGDLIREERVYWDAATLMAQAGAPA